MSTIGPSLSSWKRYKSTVKSPWLTLSHSPTSYKLWDTFLISDSPQPYTLVKALDNKLKYFFTVHTTF